MFWRWRSLCDTTKEWTTSPSRMLHPQPVAIKLTFACSTTFLFRENPLPIICPISHILTRAIRDGAILVDGYTSAEPFFATNLRAQGMKAMKVHWKPEWLKRPVFRRSVRHIGAWMKSETEPMLYSAYAFYINRLGKDTGFEDELTSYCFRRGTSNAVDGMPPMKPAHPRLILCRCCIRGYTRPGDEARPLHWGL